MLSSAANLRNAAGETLAELSRGMRSAHDTDDRLKSDLAVDFPSLWLVTNVLREYFTSLDHDREGDFRLIGQAQLISGSMRLSGLGMGKLRVL